MYKKASIAGSQPIVHPFAANMPYFHQALFPPVPAESIQGDALYAHLLYPTDGKLHKFSRKQQKIGHHSAAYTNDGKLPLDLYITPREIEDDTVGSSFDGDTIDSDFDRDPNPTVINDVSQLSCVEEEVEGMKESTKNDDSAPAAETGQWEIPRLSFSPQHWKVPFFAGVHAAPLPGA